MGTQLLWGAVAGSQFSGPIYSPTALEDFSKRDAAGKHVSLAPLYYPFAYCGKRSCSPVPFPDWTLDAIRRYGAIPLLSWASATPQDREGPGTSDSTFSLRNVVNGKLDAYIYGYARAAKAWGHPFFLRFDWEFNGNWFVWGNGTNHNTAREFVLAWRHVHDIFGRVGAHNATWVWCPNNGNQHGSVANLASFWPGDRYVDWTCADVYNFGAVPGHTWETWDQLAGPTYRALLRVAPRKPVMIGEFASSPVGGSQADWLADTLAEVPVRYPRIRAMVLYDTASNWEIETNPLAQTAFSRAIADPTFASNVFGNVSSSPIPAP